MLSCAPWHISDLHGNMYVCLSRSKIQYENWQSQKRLEHLLKGAFERGVATLKGRNPACHFKNDFTLQLKP